MTRDKKPKLTKAETVIRDSMLLNTGGEVARRLQLYWDARDEGLSKSIRQRHMQKSRQGSANPQNLASCHREEVAIHEARKQRVRHRDPAGSEANRSVRPTVVSD